MAAPSSGQRKDEILEDFQALLQARKDRAHAIQTREEQARRRADRALVESASAYTAERIVKGLADVQLDFSRSIDALTATLDRETRRLDEIHRAIDVETRHLETLRHVRLAADALDLLRQEHEADVRAFEAESEAQRAELDREIEQTRAAWTRDDEAFERQAADEDARLEQERRLAEDEHRYAVERQRRKELDELEDKRRRLEHSLREEEVQKRADWEEREAALEARREQADAFEQQLAAFEEELSRAIQDTREAARRRTRQEVETEAALFEREVAARRRSYENRIQLLETDVAQQAEQIAHLTAQLQAAIRQTQELAGRAMEAPRGGRAGTT